MQNALGLDSALKTMPRAGVRQTEIGYCFLGNDGWSRRDA
jgi:hypothetical protein